MTDQKLLTILTEARSVLAESYIKWYLQDSKGGHCAAGSVLHKAHGVPNWSVVMDKLDTVAKQLHPELVGKSEPREDPLGINKVYGTVLIPRDHFNTHPVVYINNHLGKEAVLAVFDAAILDVELKLSPGKMVPEVVQTDAIQEQSATREVSRDGEAGQDLACCSAGIRSSVEGTEATGKG